MHQQINLYQPIFREEKKLFSLNTVAISLGLVAGALIAMTAMAKFNVDKLEQAVTKLKDQQAMQQKAVETADALISSQGNPDEVRAAAQLLRTQLADRSKALETLRSGVAGEPRGFASRLTALARQHTDGVWLEELFLGGGPNGLMLRGRCTDAELLPLYLQLLTRESELAGARFDEVVIDRRKYHESAPVAVTEAAKDDETGTIRFSVSSKSALMQIPEYRK